MSITPALVQQLEDLFTTFYKKQLSLLAEAILDDPKNESLRQATKKDVVVTLTCLTDSTYQFSTDGYVGDCVYRDNIIEAAQEALEYVYAESVVPNYQYVVKPVLQAATIVT